MITMTDILQSHFDEYEIQQLETSLVDPCVKKTMEAIEEYNTLLVSEETSERDREGIVRSLDEMWEPFLGEVLTFSGVVRSVDGSFEPIELNGVEVLSNGFCVAKDTETGIYSIEHYLMINNNLFNPNAHPRFMSNAVASVAESSIEFSSASPERAAAWIYTSFPDLREDLDIAIHNADTVPETIEALAGIDLPEDLSPDDAFSIRCIATYLNTHVATDKTLPYAIEMSGYIDIEREDITQTIYIQDTTPMLFISRDIVIRPLVADEDTISDLALRINGFIIGADQSEAPLPVSIPLRTIRNMRSTRDDFYA